METERLSNLPKGTMLCPESHAPGNQHKGAGLGVSTPLRPNEEQFPSCSAALFPYCPNGASLAQVTIQHRTHSAHGPCLLPSSKKKGRVGSSRGAGSRLWEGLITHLSPHTHAVFQEVQSPLWVLLLIQQPLTRQEAGGSLVSLQSQGQVLPSTLRMSLHLSQPVSSSVRWAVEWVQ